tara:strand:+ start:3932 stop:5035 length:1104 start_codon:yes stop_codon:yes gene_type:complete
MANILLLGGTGAIGQYVQRESLGRGHRVSVTTRREHTKARTGVKYIRGNALDRSFVSELLKTGRYDAVVDFMVYRTADFFDRVPNFLEQSGHYVFLSSYRVFADSADKPITEQTPRLLDVSEDPAYLETDEYALAKARQEDVLRAQKRTNWTIVRPSITYAENRLQFGCLEAGTFVPRVQKGLPVVIPTEMMDRQTTMTWAGDTAKMIVSLLFNNAAQGTDFNVLTNNTRTWREISEIYQDIMGLKVQEVDLASYLSLGLNPYQVIYDRLFDRACDNTKICEAVGLALNNMVTPEVGLRQSYSGTSISHPALSRLHGRMDALCGFNRLGEVRSLKDGLGYFIGQNSFLNACVIHANTNKFARPLKVI